MTLKERDKKYIWHPFDQMKGSDILPFTVVKEHMFMMKKTTDT